MNPISNNVFCSPSLSAPNSDRRGDPNRINFPQKPFVFWCMSNSFFYSMNLLQASYIMCLKPPSSWWVFFFLFLMTLFHFDMRAVNPIWWFSDILPVTWRCGNVMPLWSLVNTCSTCLCIIHGHIKVWGNKARLYIRGDRLDWPWGIQALCDLSAWHGWPNTELDFPVQNTLNAVISHKTLYTHKRPAATIVRRKENQRRRQLPFLLWSAMCLTKTLQNKWKSKDWNISYRNGLLHVHNIHSYIYIVYMTTFKGW